MKILVTGGAGFVGTNLVLSLIERGHQPVILDDFSSGLMSNVPDGITLLHGSITEIDVLFEAANGVEAIVHLAARGSVPRSILNPVLTQKVNFDGTLNVLEVARKRKLRVIFSSSSSVYGGNGETPKTEGMTLKPLTPYAASKLSGEALMMAYAKSYNLCVTSLRFFNVFGPWQRPDHIYSAVIPKWIWSAMNGIPLQIFGDGEQSRDFTFVKQVIEIIVSSLENKINHPEPINLAFGNKISLNQLIEEFRKYFPTLDVRYLPPRAGDVFESQNSPALVNRIFPDIRIENFNDSLRQTIHWFEKESSKIIGGPQLDE